MSIRSRREIHSVFICYRKEDAQFTAKRLADHLRRVIGNDHVFWDKDIPSSSHWPSTLEQQAASATLMFVLIGPNWLTARDPVGGARRLDDPHDWVRREIETALDHGVTVHPVTIAPALPPTKSELRLIEGFDKLADAQALPVRRALPRRDRMAIDKILQDSGFELIGDRLPNDSGGHPPGLSVLFFAEMWERFAYYGVRGLLVLYLVKLGSVSEAQASLYCGAYLSLVYAVGIAGGIAADRILGFQRSVLLGGSLLCTGLTIITLSGREALLTGLAVIAVGNGLFKPNITSLVGELYDSGDPRRDSGFTVFYIGINVGAFLAPIVCAGAAYAFGESEPNYRIGFGVAGFGMLVSLSIFAIGRRFLIGLGEPPPRRDAHRYWLAALLAVAGLVTVVRALMMNTRALELSLAAVTVLVLVSLAGKSFREYLLGDRIVARRLAAFIILLLANALFWSLFEQSHSSLTLFADKHVDTGGIVLWPDNPIGVAGLFACTSAIILAIGRKSFANVTAVIVVVLVVIALILTAEIGMPFEWYQSINSLLVIMLAPAVALTWTALARRNMNPAVPGKFAMALLLVGVGFAFVLWSIGEADSRFQTSALLLTMFYVLQTMGELCIAPVGLSMVSRSVPESMRGLGMGAWFLSIACANYLAGLIAYFARGGDQHSKNLVGDDSLQAFSSTFQPVMWIAFAAGLTLFLARRPLSRLLAGN